MVKVFDKFVCAGYAILFLIFSVHMIFINDNWKEFSPDVVKIISFAIFIFVVQEIIIFVLKKLPDKIASVIRCLAFITFIVFQTYIFITVNMAFGWDAWRVYEVADKGLAASGYFDYLAYNPNNIAISLVGRLWVKFMGWRTFFSTAQKLVVLNIICFNISLVLGYTIVKRVAGKYSADRFAFLFCIIIGLSPWIAVFYTDILAMVFPITALFFYMLSEEYEKSIIKYSFLALTAFVTVIGGYIKITSVIALIAIYISIQKERYTFKDIRKQTLVLLLTVRITVTGMEILLKPVKKQISDSYPDIKAKGIYNFFEIGLMGYKQGSWTEEAVNSNDFATDKEYVEAAKSRIRERMEGYGEKLVNHYLGKLIWAGTDGTFIYGSEGAFYHSSSDNTDSIRGRLHNFMYIDRDIYQNFYAQWLQASWLLVCVFSIFGFMQSDKKNDIFFIMKLAVGGLFLFLMIFENRARYVVLYTPFIIAVAQIALNNLTDKIKCKG